MEPHGASCLSDLFRMARLACWAVVVLPHGPTGALDIPSHLGVIVP